MAFNKKDPDYYSKIGKLGGDKNKENHGIEYFAELGKKGGETCARRHGREFYQRISKQGLKKRYSK